MTEREKIAGRIRALLAKTVEAGCTEGEAIAAAAKAAELLAAYNLGLDEVEMRAAPFDRHDEAHHDDVGERLWKPATAIAKLTGCRHWTSDVGVYPIEQTFFGFDHEIEIAKYLLEICARAMRTERNKVLKSVALLRPARQMMHVRPLLDGMADRLQERILDLIPPTPAGSGLVVLRHDLITQALADAGIHLGPATARSSRFGDPLYETGRRAAENVQFNTGVRTDGAQPRIGSARRS